MQHLRAPRIRSFIVGSSTTISSLHPRGYAISVQEPRVWPGKTGPRVFSERKTFLYNQFTNMLKQTSSEPMLFLHHKDFRAAGMVKLRREIIAATLPKGVSLSLMAIPPDQETLPQLNVIRTSIFGVALREYAPLDAETTQSIAKIAGNGGLAVLSLPTLDPPKLQSILRALDRAVRKKKANADASKVPKKGNADEDDGHIPGRRQKRQRPILDPELSLLGALIEGRVFAAEGVRGVATLPTLDSLRAQIVGLLQSPAVQLAMVLGEASGGKLSRTLEGLKKGLEEREGIVAESGAPAP